MMPVKVLASSLATRIQSKTAKIGIVGMGYMGIPLAEAFCHIGFPTLGFDVDASKVEMLNLGRTYIRHISNETLTSMVGTGRFSATGQFSKVGDLDVIILCVPTPLARHRDPNLRYIEDTCETLARYLRQGQLVVLESTTYPGTTCELVRAILEKSGRTAEKDFFLAYSPEREDPGNPNFKMASIPKVVGGHGPTSLKLADQLYSQLGIETVPVSSMETAEAVKLTENIFRAVNIALVNELKIVFTKMGIDIWEVIEAAKSKPFGFMPFYPGPGLGGHCVPIDPFYLTWKAREYGISTRFIELAGEINTQMPQFVIDRLVGALNDRQQRSVSGSRLLVVGIAYKKNVDDTRETPALEIIEKLEALGASVDYYDPLVKEIPLTRKHGALAGRHSIEWTAGNLASYQAALIITDHDNVNYKELVEACALVVDTRNATKGMQGSAERVVKA